MLNESQFLSEHVVYHLIQSFISSISLEMTYPCKTDFLFIRVNLFYLKTGRCSFWMNNLSDFSLLI